MSDEDLLSRLWKGIVKGAAETFDRRMFPPVVVIAVSREAGWTNEDLKTTYEMLKLGYRVAAVTENPTTWNYHFAREVIPE